MNDTDGRRKQRFEAALKLAGETMQTWSEKQGVTYTHLYYVLRGDRESPRLIAAIDALIAEHLPAAPESAVSAASVA